MSDNNGHHGDGPTRLAAQLSDQPLPPVDDWNPPLSGVMDLRIAADGRWYYQDSLIQRERLVKLFARVLRRDADDQYYLLTPVEKWQIQVEDVPFLISDVNRRTDSNSAPAWCFSTNLGEHVIASRDHPLRVDYSTADGQPRPYLRVRGRLWGRLTPAVFLQLAEAAELVRDSSGTLGFVIDSDGERFWLGDAE